uniref:Uncharacterized protein n=1 Tax=Romanomermis culicivorax TaxID=13658 RepID=A0A915J4G5_ROMCU
MFEKNPKKASRFLDYDAANSTGRRKNFFLNIDEMLQHIVAFGAAFVGRNGKHFHLNKFVNTINAFFFAGRAYFGSKTTANGIKF